MRQLMIKDSQKFAGVTDGTTTVSNASGESVGVRGDGFKLGGTRIDLDLLCGASYQRCVTTVDSNGNIHYFESSAMNPMKKTVLFILSVSAALTGCTIGPNGICGPQTPSAYCDKEVYQRLTQPKPEIEYWEKAGMTVNDRLESWRRCGGNENGWLSPPLKVLENERRQGERDDLGAYRRLEKKLQDCMIEKGYRDIGSCANPIMISEQSACKRQSTLR